MAQPSLFDAPLEPPWIKGRTPQARHASASGAQSAAVRWKPKTRAYVELLKAYGPVTDQDAANLLTWPLSSVNSVRNGLGDLVQPSGFCEQQCGSKRTKRVRWMWIG